MPMYTVSFEDQALVASTAQTLVQIAAPSSRRVKLIAWSVSFDGVSAGDPPVKVEIRRQTTAGTGTAATIVKLEEADPNALSTATVVYTGEPSYGDLLYPYRITPNGGVWLVEYSLGREPKVSVSDRWGIVARAGAAVNATGYIQFEE